MKQKAIGIVASIAVACSAQSQFLLTFDSNNDVGILLDAFDGSVVNSNYLDIGAAAASVGVTSTTPIEGIEVGNQIWVSDQVGDRIYRFDRDSGGFLGDITTANDGTGGLNNIRGMTLVGNTVFAALGNDSAFTNEGIVAIDINTLTVSNNFNGRDPADTSYFDIVEYNGDLLVGNIDSGNDGIDRYDTSGNYLGVFSSSDGATSYDFLQQMYVRDDDSLLGAGFSLPSGVFAIGADGTDNGIVAATDFGPRGVYELGNGDILWTNGNFLRTDSNIILEGESFRFLSPVTIPAPASLTLIGALALGASRRRR